MKKTLLAGLVLLGISVQVNAKPGVFLGVGYNFGGTVGVSLKVLSTNQEDKFAAVAGVNYFPKTERISFDAGAGYLFKHGATTLTWDFTQQEAQMGLGYVNTKK